MDLQQQLHSIKMLKDDLHRPSLLYLKLLLETFISKEEENKLKYGSELATTKDENLLELKQKALKSNISINVAKHILTYFNYDKLESDIDSLRNFIKGEKND